jgi:hypothetical protein
VRSLVALTTLFPLVTFCGCGASLPTEDDAKQGIQEQITKQNQNRLKLVSFHKTNGQASEENGVPHYKMEFEGEVEVTEDCAGSLSSLTTYVPQDLVVDVPSYATGGAPKKIVAQKAAPKDVKKGVRQKISGEIGFEKTENGWRATYAGARGGG